MSSCDFPSDSPAQLGFIDFYRTSGFVVFIISVKCSVIYVLKYFSLPPSKSFPPGTHMLDHFILYHGSPNLFYYQSLYPLGAYLQFLYCFVFKSTFLLQCQICNHSHLVKFSFQMLYFSWLEFPVGLFISPISHIMITFSLNT